MQIQGIQYVMVNGEELPVADSAGLDMGGPVAEEQQLHNGTDFTERMAPGVIELQAGRKKETSLRALQGLRLATLVVRLRDGSAYAGSRMNFVGSINLDPITGRYAARFVGDPLEEM